MALEWLLAGHGWQDPSPDRGLKVPWAQAEREKAFIKTCVKNMLLRLDEVRRGKQDKRSSETSPLIRGGDLLQIRDQP